MADGIFNESKFKSKITLTTFILSVIVVYIHSENIGHYSVLPDTISGRFCIWLQNVFVTSMSKGAVPCFLFISGILFFRNYSLDKIWIKYKSRFKSVVVPYIVVNTFYTVVAIIGHYVPYISRNLGENWSMKTVSLGNILKGIFLFEYNKIFWFMLFLIACIAISPVIYLLINNKYIGMLTCIAVIASAFYTGNLYHLNFIYYILGGYLGIHYKTFTETIKQKSTCFLAMLLFLLAIILYHVTNYSEIASLRRIYGYCHPLILVLTFYIYVDLFNDIQIKEYMKKSFLIYEMQLIFLAFYKKLFRMVLPVNNVFAIITYVIVPIFVVISILVVSSEMKKRTPRLYKVLAGGRL